MHSSIVVEHLREQFKNDQGVGIACIYCRYNDRAEQTPQNLLSSLCMQLAQQNTCLSHDVKRLYESNIDKRTRPTLSEISKTIQLEVSRFTKVFIVIVALDECADFDSRAAVVTELQRLRKKANLMIFSRPLENLKNKFQEMITVEIKATDDDLRAYVTNQISCADRLSLNVRNDSRLERDIQHTVVQKSQNMY